LYLPFYTHTSSFQHIHVLIATKHLTGTLLMQLHSIFSRPQRQHMIIVVRCKFVVVEISVLSLSNDRNSGTTRVRNAVPGTSHPRPTPAPNHAHNHRKLIINNCSASRRNNRNMAVRTMRTSNCGAGGLLLQEATEG